MKIVPRLQSHINRQPEAIWLDDCVTLVNGLKQINAPLQLNQGLEAFKTKFNKVILSATEKKN
jgi:hypothetical protein